MAGGMQLLIRIIISNAMEELPHAVLLLVADCEGSVHHLEVHTLHHNVRISLVVPLLLRICKPKPDHLCRLIHQQSQSTCTVTATVKSKGDNKALDAGSFRRLRTCSQLYQKGDCKVLCGIMLVKRKEGPHWSLTVGRPGPSAVHFQLSVP